MDGMVVRHAGGGRGAPPHALAGQARDAQPGYSRGPGWMLALPPAAALVVMLWGITGPSYTPDESATMSALHRSFPQLLKMLGNIDAVHGPYYIAMWFYVRVLGTSELATRLPSALAMVVAAAVTAAIGRRLVSSRTGLAAGLIVAALPEISLYAQDARPYAFMVALAVAASYALVRVLTESPDRRTRWLVAYGGYMTLLGLSQVIALLLIVAHAVTVLMHCRADKGEPARRSLSLGWLAAVVVAVVVCSPVLWLGYQQRSSFYEVNYRPWTVRVEQLFGSWLVVIALAAVLACGIAVVLAARRWPGFRASSPRRAAQSRWPASLVWVCVPWLVVPPAVLLTASQVGPVYTVRYVVYCLPAAALLVGAALDVLGWVVGTAALAAIVLAGSPLQVAQRAAAGHGRNIREVDQVIAAHEQRGDAVLYGLLPAQYTQFAYPYGLARLRDVQLAQTPAESATLTGTDVNGTVVRNRLRDVRRVWLVGGGPAAVKVNVGIVTKEGFRLVRLWRIRADPVMLYARASRSPAHRPGARLVRLRLSA
jgi:mannosyltransferase